MNNQFNHGIIQQATDINYRPEQLSSEDLEGITGGIVTYQGYNPGQDVSGFSTEELKILRWDKDLARQDLRAISRKGSIMNAEWLYEERYRRGNFHDTNPETTQNNPNYWTPGK